MQVNIGRVTVAFYRMWGGVIYCRYDDGKAAPHEYVPVYKWWYKWW